MWLKWWGSSEGPEFNPQDHLENGGTINGVLTAYKAMLALKCWWSLIWRTSKPFGPTEMSGSRESK
jgi:hypothetical protein